MAGIITVSAPGKVILTGEHAVVLGKQSIATSLSLRTHVKIIPEEGNIFHISLPDLPVPLNRSLSISTIFSLFPRAANQSPMIPELLNEETLIRLIEFAKDETKASVAILFYLISLSPVGMQKGYRIELKSDLPLGAGLGSSAAFNVCLAAGFLSAFKVYACGGCAQCTSLSPTSLCNGHPGFIPCSKQATLINQWAFQGEKIMHGNPSGIDNAVSTFGHALSFTRKDGYRLISRIPPLRILITDTKVSRQTKKLVESMVQRSKDHPAVIEPVLSLIHTISDECLKAFETFFEQSARGDPQAYTNLYKYLELMIDLNHHLLTGGLGVGHNTLDEICRLTLMSGFHSKLTGAGGGGCAITLIPYGATDEEIKEVKLRLEHHKYSCWEAAIGVPGVFFHTHPSSHL